MAEELTVQQLAERIGPRRGGRPTSPRTVRYWMLHGLVGVKLRSWLDVSVRKTTWEDYLHFRTEVGRVKERRWQVLREAAQRTGRRDERTQKRADRARAALEAMGAR